MHQAVLSAPNTLEWHDGPTPQPQAGEVIVRIRAALTCGTDLKTYRRGHPKLAFGPFGHEASGDVVALGAGVDKFQLGDGVMWVQTAPCGCCPQCEAGLENLCARLTHDMALGAYADYLRLPAGVVARNLFHKPRGMSYIEAAFLEPLASVVHGWNVLRRVLPRPAEAAFHQKPQPLPPAVAIVGAGSIGLLHLAYALHAGIAATVVARQPERLSLGAQLGARAVPESDLPALQASFPCVIDCGGSHQSWRDALRLAAPGGCVVFFSGLAKGEDIALDATRIHYDELTLLGSFHFTPADVREARELLRAGVVPARSLISQVLPLDSLGEAFMRLDRRQGYKYALIPPPALPRWL